MPKECLAEKILVVLGQKWVLNIIRTMELEGKKRFNEIQKELKTISPRTLSKRLKELKAMKLIDKKLFNEMPPRVEYSLTKRGKELVKCFKQLDDWVKKYN